MSGQVLPTITHTGFQPLYGSGGGGGGAVSSFQTASISSLTASTITAGTIAAANLTAAINNSALFFTSSFSGLASTATSTVLFSVSGGGTYSVNLNLQTTNSTSAPLADVFVAAPAQNTSMFVNDIANTNSATYNITAFGQGTEAVVYLANNGGLSPPYVGSYTRIGF